MTKKCKIDECEDLSRERYFRGWCRNHYQRWQKHGDPRGGVGFAPDVPLKERIRLLTDRSGGSNACWPWLGMKREYGYGRILIDGRLRPVTHVIYELDHGPLPVDKPFMLHSCDNPPCVNLRHLHPGTQAENVQDMIEKARKNPVRGEQHYMSKLSEAEVRQIRQALVSGERQTEIAERYDVSKHTIYGISKRKVWAWL